MANHAITTTQESAVEAVSVATTGVCEPTSQTHLAPAQDLREEAARAVAAPDTRAGELDRRNDCLGFLSLSKALDHDTVFFVDVRDQMLAVDFDGPDASRDAARLMVALLRRGLAPVMCSSGQRGRRHVFCLLPRERSKAQLLRLLGPIPGGDVRHAIRPPLSRHRVAGRSTFLVPSDAEEALARLTAGATGRRALGRSAIHVLTSDQSDDVSVTMWSLALGAANAGWTWEDFTLAVTGGAEVAAVFSRRVRAGEAQAWSWLRNYVWEPARAYVLANPAVRSADADPDLLRVAAWALGRPWSGRSGPTDFCVLMALLWGWRRSGRCVFNLSEREIQLLSGISSRATVSSSLRRLQAMQIDGEDLLQVAHPTNPAEAMSRSPNYEFSIPASAASASEEDLARAWFVIGHDAFRNAVGLGKSRAMVLIALRDGLVMNETEIATATGLSSAVVIESISDLAGHDLLEPVGDAWTCGRGDLDAAAQVIGAAGRGARQREQIRRERDARDIRLASHRPQGN